MKGAIRNYRMEVILHYLFSPSSRALHSDEFPHLNLWVTRSHNAVSAGPTGSGKQGGLNQEAADFKLHIIYTQGTRMTEHKANSL